jgi:hypothetical protein
MATASIDFLEKLIGFPTVSRDSNLDLIAFVRSEAEKAGATCAIVESEDGRKANLLATIGPAYCPASCFRRTPTSCRWKDRHGHRTPSRSERQTGGFMAAAART